MTTTLQSSIAAQLGWTWTDQVGSSAIIDSNRFQFRKQLADGVDADEADAVWHVEDEPLAPGASVTFDLDALEQACFGDTITIPLSKVKALLVVNKSASGYLLVGAAAEDEWHAPFGAAGNTVKVMPDSPLLLVHSRDGWNVEPGSTALKIAAIGAESVFDVAILGTLAGDGGSSSSSGE